MAALPLGVGGEMESCTEVNTPTPLFVGKGGITCHAEKQLLYLVKRRGGRKCWKLIWKKSMTDQFGTRVYVQAVEGKWGKGGRGRPSVKAGETEQLYIGAKVCLCLEGKKGKGKSEESGKLCEATRDRRQTT